MKCLYKPKTIIKTFIVVFLVCIIEISGIIKLDTISASQQDTIVSIALGEKGKTNGSIYTFGNGNVSWCAYFVAWSARQSAISTSVIPTIGNCDSLYSNLINNCGAVVVNSPQKGDLVFYKSRVSGKTFQHVGLMIDNSLSIQGNLGGAVKEIYANKFYYGSTSDTIVKASEIVYLRPSYTVDKTSPSITNVSVTNKTNKGYQINCNVSDNVGVTRVMFPTWTLNNGQDDLVWHVGNISGNTASFYIPSSSHKNEGGNYATHIYAYDSSGNVTFYGVDIYLDQTVPVISNVIITDVTTLGYTVTCTVTDNVAVDRVQFPTWTDSNGQDDIQSNWPTSSLASGAKSGNTYTYRVNDSSHNYEKGYYTTHIYAYDSSGNVAGTSSGSAYVINNLQAIKTITYLGHTYKVYNDNLTWEQAKIKCNSLGGHLVTIESVGEQNAIKAMIGGLSREGYYMGLSDNISEGTFKLLNGLSPSYTNWASGEPNDANGNEDSGEIYTNGLWNDINGTARNIGFICEWDTLFPSVPENIKASSSGYNSNKLTWTGASGATGYVVYRSTSQTSGYTRLKVLSGTSFTDTGLTTGKTYYYKVIAYKSVNGANIYGSYTGVVNSKPVPSVPGSLKAVSSGYTSNKITWIGVSGATGYVVYRSTSQTSGYTRLKVLSGTSFTDTGLTRGKTYYYKVIAYKNVSGTNIYGSYTGIVSAKTLS